jgi:hypothetical protein
MTSPSTELEVRLLEALDVPRSLGDVMFLFPELKAAGRDSVEVAMASLVDGELVAPLGGTKLWSLSETGARWLSEDAEWLVHCDRVIAMPNGVMDVVGVVQRGVVKSGDRFHDGRGLTGTVLKVDDWDPASGGISIRAEATDALVLPLVLRRWGPMAGAGEAGPS